MGKKKQFDEEEILTLIAKHFWKHGYTATKVDQLATLTGLTKTSIYNAFGNKEALFLHVIDLYIENSLNFQRQNIDTNKSMSDNLRQIFELVFLSENNKQLAYGCLITNSILELADNEPKLYAKVTYGFDQMRHEMQHFFSYYGEHQKLVPTMSIDALTDLFMTFIQGLRVQSRNREPIDALKHSIDAFLNLISSLEINQDG